MRVRVMGIFRENANQFRSGDAALIVAQAEGGGSAIKERKRMVSLMVLVDSLVALRAAGRLGVERLSSRQAAGRRALAIMLQAREGIPVASRSG
jgi:hypothetical protein